MAEQDTPLAARRFVVHAPAEHGPFRHPLNPASEVYGALLGRQVGLSRLGVNLARLPPGKESFVFHMHQARLAPGKESYVFHRHAIEEEWLYVLSGRALLELGDERVELSAGDFAGLPPSAPAHLVTNPHAEEVRYLEGGEVLAVDVVDFPRLGKRTVRIGEERTLYPLGAGEPFVHAPPRLPGG